MIIKIKSRLGANESSWIVESAYETECSDADRVVSLFGHPVGVCDFCKKVVCTCKPLTKPKPVDEKKQKALELKEQKRQRTLQRLMEIFGEGDTPLCRFK